MVESNASKGVRGTVTRSSWYIVAAYIVGAAVGASVGAATFFVEGLFGGAAEFIGDIQSQVVASLDTAILLFVICLMFEMIIATPILLIFRLRNWRSPNPIAIAVLGFSVSGLLAAAISAVPFPDGTSGPLGYFTGSELTLRGWFRLLRNVTQFGTIGAATAAAFNLIAIRRKS